MAVDSFARLLLFKLLKSGVIPGPDPGPVPGKDTPAEQYNAAVDRFNDLSATLFQSGYDLMGVKIATQTLKAVRAIAIPASYVPLDTFNALENRINAIEALFSVPGAAIMQVPEIDGGDDVEFDELPHAQGEYITEEEYEALKQCVDEIEAVLSLNADKILMVRE